MNWLNSLEVVGVDPPYIHTIIQNIYIYVYITCGILSEKWNSMAGVGRTKSHMAGWCRESPNIRCQCAVFVYRIQTTRGAVIANQMTTGSGVW